MIDRELSQDCNPLSFEAMFEAAVTKFTKEVCDAHIPVSCLADADKFEVLSLVVKKKGKRFWNSAKYKPCDFTLQDILGENNVIDSIPKRMRELMPIYEMTHHLSVRCRVGGNLKRILKVKASGLDAIALEIKFSKIQKCEIPEDTLKRVAGK